MAEARIPTTAETADVPNESSGTIHDQLAAETLMVAWLVSRLGVTLVPRSIRLANGARMDIDAVSDDPPILCQAWTHQDEPGPVQQTWLIAHAFKLVAARRLLGHQYRLILLLDCWDAARSIRTSGGWHAAAVAAEGIEIMVAELHHDARE